MEKITITFKDEADLRHFVIINMPLAIKPQRKAKTHFISPYTRGHAMISVIDRIIDALKEKSNENNQTI